MQTSLNPGSRQVVEDILSENDELKDMIEQFGSKRILKTIGQKLTMFLQHLYEQTEQEGFE